MLYFVLMRFLFLCRVYRTHKISSENDAKVKNIVRRMKILCLYEYINGSFETPFISINFIMSLLTSVTELF